MSPKPWSSAEIALLREKAPHSTIKELRSLIVDRHRTSIYVKARKLGISVPATYVGWSPQEVSVLEEHYPSSDWDTLLSALPRRSQRSISIKATELGISRLVITPSVKPNSWSESEVAVLKEHYPSSTLETICSYLPNRTPASIKQKASKLGLSRKEAPGGTWSSVEIRQLRKYYPTAPWSRIMKALPRRSKDSIRVKAHSLGISRRSGS